MTRALRASQVMAPTASGVAASTTSSTEQAEIHTESVPIWFRFHAVGAAFWLRFGADGVGVASSASGSMPLAADSYVDLLVPPNTFFRHIADATGGYLCYHKADA